MQAAGAPSSGPGNNVQAAPPRCGLMGPADDEHGDAPPEPARLHSQHSLSWRASEVPDTFERMIGPYAIKRTLAKSWRTKVKLAEDPLTGEQVVLKCVAHNDSEMEMARAKETQVPHERLAREVCALERVKHAHVVSLVEFVPHALYPKGLERHGKALQTPLSERTSSLATLDEDLGSRASEENADPPLPAAANPPQETPFTPAFSKPVAMLVMEFAPFGDLCNFLLEAGPVPEWVGRAWFRQLLNALSAVHGQGLCHRDLRPENVLLDASLQLKLSGFGLAVPLDADGSDNEECTHIVGSMTWLAPEALHLEQGETLDGRKADLWSLGLLLFALLTAKPPFHCPCLADGHYRAFTMVT